MHAVPDNDLVELLPADFGSERLHQLAKRALLALVVVAAATVGIAVLSGSGSPLFLVAEAVALAGAVAGYRILTPAKRTRLPRGDKMSRMLARLADDGWRVLSDVCTGVRTVDHVLVGPAGIFTVKVVGQRGIERSNRTDRGLISQGYAQGQWVGRAVGATVDPLLVFSRSLVLPRASQHWSVWVLSAGALPRHLRGLERKLSAQEIDATYERLVHAVAAHADASSWTSPSAMSTARSMVA